MPDKPLRLGATRPWGLTTCDFGIGGPQCAKPATTHVMWLDSSDVSNTCAEHLDFIRQRAAQPYETHTFGPDCSMPGALWHRPSGDQDEGFCMFDGVDDAELLAAELEPANRGAHA